MNFLITLALIAFIFLYFRTCFYIFLWLKFILSRPSGLPANIRKIREENLEFNIVENKLIKSALHLLFYILSSLVLFILYFRFRINW
ncbi:hypothetical protein CH366_19340 [Leptospira harrisiae]|nr:hypothetical protein CH366_19340 [Leptospira harrisiae]